MIQIYYFTSYFSKLNLIPIPSFRPLPVRTHKDRINMIFPDSSQLVHIILRNHLIHITNRLHDRGSILLIDNWCLTLS